MSEFRDLDIDAPPIPENTCPEIDQLIESAQRIAYDLECARKKTEDDCAARAISEAVNDFGNLLNQLTCPFRKIRSNPIEKIRAANEQLRECGVYWRETAKKLCAKIDDIQVKLREAEHLL